MVPREVRTGLFYTRPRSLSVFAFLETTEPVVRFAFVLFSFLVRDFWSDQWVSQNCVSP